MNVKTRAFEFLAVLVMGLVLLYAAETRPGYLSDVTLLGGLLLLEIILASVWHYERIFFGVLMFSFLWAGTGMPFSSVGIRVRWFFLFIGAVAGIVRWFVSDRAQRIRGLHFAALLCVLSAAASSQVSILPQASLLKTGSLLLLFLYGCFGARLAAAGRELVFFQGLLVACEVLTYLSGVLYLVAHYEFFGNPNSLGAVMGVAVIPVLLWGIFVAKDGIQRNRRLFALCLAAYLLYSSVSRAGMLACLVSATMMCVALRRWRLLVQGSLVLVMVTTLLAVAQPEQFASLVSAFSENLLYKGKPQQGLLGSREGPWQETIDIINRSPWFGTGFGTDLSPNRTGGPNSLVRSGEVQEHGNSYLALLEYVGLLGAASFAILLFLVLRLIYRTCCWMRRSQSPFHYAVPLALICTAGLIHAFFEDWLFAVGYYLTVFFWASVFILADLQTQPTPLEPTDPKRLVLG